MLKEIKGSANRNHQICTIVYAGTNMARLETNFRELVLMITPKRTRSNLALKHMQSDWSAIILLKLG